MPICSHSSGADKAEERRATADDQPNPGGLSLAAAVGSPSAWELASLSRPTARHVPEFSFEHDIDSVRRAVKAMGLVAGPALFVQCRVARFAVREVGESPAARRSVLSASDESSFQCSAETIEPSGNGSFPSR
jgi:hypothetical protein